MSILPAHSRICFIVVIFFGGVVFGQEAGEPLSLLEVLDADGDGTLSAREITRSAPLIRRLDRNGDGKLTGEELTVSDGDEDSDADSSASSSRARNSAASSRNSRAGSARAGSARAGNSRASKAAIDGAINRAASFYMQKKYEQAGKEIEKALELIEQLIDDDDLDTLTELTESLKRFERAHKLLTEQGVDLPDLLDVTDFGLGAKQPAERTSSSRPRQTDTADAAPNKPGTVSFTKQIAPILIKKCGSCHVKDNKAELSFASYSTLMVGAKGAAVIKAGNADSSFLVDMVEGGDMPPEGDPLPEDELKLIRTWIDEGAVFDGDDEEAQLSRT